MILYFVTRTTWSSFILLLIALSIPFITGWLVSGEKLSLFRVIWDSRTLWFLLACFLIPIGGMVGLVLGFITTTMSPIDQHSNKLYRLAMIVSGILVASVTAILPLKMLLSDIVMEVLIIFAISTGVYFGLITQYLVSSYIWDMQEKRKSN